MKIMISSWRHNIHHLGWYKCGCKLLCSLEHVKFSCRICQSLRSLLIDMSGKVMCVLSPFTNILMVAALFVKLHLLASLLKQCLYTARDSFSFCCISNKMGYGSVNIGVAYFHLQYILDIIPGFTWCDNLWD